MFSDHSGSKVYNKNNISRKSPIWKLSKTVLVTKGQKSNEKIRKYFKLNKNENIKFQNMEPERGVSLSLDGLERNLEL